MSKQAHIADGSRIRPMDNALLTALIISNITSFGLAMLFASVLLGRPLGEIASLAYAPKHTTAYAAKQTNEEDELFPPQKNTFVPGVVVVQFKDAVAAAIDTAQSSGSASAVKKVNAVKRIESRFSIAAIQPVIKLSTPPRTTRSKMYAQLQQRAQTSFPQRQARVSPQKGTRANLAPIYKLSFTNTGLDVSSVVTELSKDPDIVFAEPNYIYSTLQANTAPSALKTASMIPIPPVANDPFYNSTGSWGQQYDDLWGIKKIKADEAWSISEGKGITVAVVDTGLDYTHPDIKENVWVNSAEIPDNGIDDDTNGFVDDTKGYDFTLCETYVWNGWFYACTQTKLPDNDPMDRNGHGTHVSGIVAAIRNNRKGVVGVAPKSKIMSVKGLHDVGIGTEIDLANAIYYAANNGADVMNNSWGGSDSQLISNALVYAHKMGVVIVGAAGNFNGLTIPPASLRESMAVSAFTQTGEKTYFSSYGKIDVAAPGGGLITDPPLQSPCQGLRNILSLSSAVNDFEDCLNVAPSYTRLAGTSMASPYVAGVAALVLAQNPTFSTEEVRWAIRSSADDVSIPGVDRYSGGGYVNALKAVQVNQPSVSEITSPIDNYLVNNNFQVRGTASGRGFSYYEIEWAVLPELKVWKSFTKSTTPVDNGILLDTDISSLPYRPFAIRLTTVSKDGSIYRTENHILRRPLPVTEDDNPSLMSFNEGVSIANIDSDSEREIVAVEVSNQSRTPRVFAWDPIGTLVPGFPVTLPEAVRVQGIPTIADINNDGKNEIIVAYTSDQYRSFIIALHRDGSPLDGWPVEVSGAVFSSTATTPDLDGDGYREIVVNSENGYYAFHYDGTPLDGWPLLTNAITGARAASFADMNGNGKDDIVLLYQLPDEGSYVDIKSGDGRSLPGWPISINDSLRSGKEVPIIGDIDNDGTSEIIIHADKLFVLTKEGEEKNGWPIDRFSNVDQDSAGQQNVRTPALFDMNDDGELEILAAGHDHASPFVGPLTFKIFSADGKVLKSWVVKTPNTTGISASGTPLIGNIADSITDEIAFCPGGYLDVRNLNGQPIDPWGSEGLLMNHCAPSLVNLNDGRSELVVGSLDGIYIFDLGTVDTTKKIAPWPMQYHDIQHSSNYTVKQSPAPGSSIKFNTGY